MKDNLVHLVGIRWYHIVEASFTSTHSTILLLLLKKNEC